MAAEQYAVVVTTINRPTKAVVDIQRRAHELPSPFYLIGDQKSPADFTLPGAHYLNVDDQLKTDFTFARLCPLGHYARKNIGYLAAMRDGATVIIETDDDNIPLDGFYRPRERTVTAPLVAQKGWCNVYRYFSDELIWPRGLPLDRVHDVPADLALSVERTLDCPVQQGLANDNPDVDAIYRLLLPLPVTFRDGQVMLDEGVWCPFNSQNTTFWAPAFPLLYLPFHCSFRMTDIWRSFVAQRILWKNDWRLCFHGATVYQERNDHDLMHDFRDEVPGYLHNDRIRKTLEDLPLHRGVDRIGENLVTCYTALVEIGVVGEAEIPLLQSWLDDIAALR